MPAERKNNTNPSNKEADHAKRRTSTLASSFTVRVAVLLFLSVTLCGWVLYTFYSFRAFDTHGSQEHRAIELDGIIKHLDEVLTMSARMAAATGDLKWEQRYRDFEPQLDATIKEAIRISPKISTSQAAKKIDIANVKLVAMENKAFDLVRRGDQEAATRILYGTEYEEQKRIYSDGISELTAAMRDDIKNVVDKSGVVFFGVAIGVVIAIALVLFGWGTILQMHKRITESKRAAEILQQQLHRNELILHTSVDGFCVIDVDAKIIDVNPAYCDISGYSKDELIGMKLNDLEAHESHEDIAQHIEKTMKVGHDLFETKHRRKDGKLVDIEVSTQFCDFEQDKFFFAFLRDITERKRAREKLQESEEKYRSLVTNIPDVTWTTDCEGNTIFISPNVEKVYGYKPEEIYQQGDRLWFERIHPDDTERVKEALKALFDKGIRFDVEYRIKRKDGVWIWLGDKAIAAYEKNGVMYVDGIFSDITDRKRAKKMLEDERNLLRTLMDNLPDYIYIKDAKSHFVMCNPASLHLKGATTLDEVAGKTDFDFFPREAAEQSYRLECQIFQSGQPLINREEIAVDSAGNSRWLLTTKVPFRDSSGKIMGIVGIGRDITERKRMEAELEQYKEKILRTQKYAYVDSMGTVVAHQLNQPLTVINMLLGRTIEQVKDKSLGPTILKNLKETQVEAKKAASIIARFRKYSEEPSLEVTGTVAIGDTANKIVSMLTERAKQAKMSIATKGMDDLPEVDISQTALEQILFNIVQNAIEATDGEKWYKLNVTGISTDDEIELQFSDDCCGIAAENLEKIFEPFFSTKSDGKGMGLGLEIVQHILIHCGGQIRVESQPGKGTTFYVTLPVKNAEKL